MQLTTPDHASAWKFTPADDASIRKAMAGKPGITARQLVGMLNKDVTIAAMCDRLNKLDLPLKKDVDCCRATAS